MRGEAVVVSDGGTVARDAFRAPSPIINRFLKAAMPAIPCLPAIQYLALHVYHLLSRPMLKVNP